MLLCSNENYWQIEKQTWKRVSAGRALWQTLKSMEDPGRRRGCHENNWGMSGPHRATEEHKRKDSVARGQGCRGQGLKTRPGSWAVLGLCSKAH